MSPPPSGVGPGAGAAPAEKEDATPPIFSDFFLKKIPKKIGMSVVNRFKASDRAGLPNFEDSLDMHDVKGVFKIPHPLCFQPPNNPHPLMTLPPRGGPAGAAPAEKEDATPMFPLLNFFWVFFLKKIQKRGMSGPRSFATVWALANFGPASYSFGIFF